MIPPHLPRYPPIHTYKTIRGSGGGSSSSSSSSSNSRDKKRNASEIESQTEKIDEKYSVRQRIELAANAHKSLALIEDKVDGATAASGGNASATATTATATAAKTIAVAGASK